MGEAIRQDRFDLYNNAAKNSDEFSISSQF